MDEIEDLVEIEKAHPDEWLVIEVIEEDDLGEPIKGKLITHSKVKEEIYEISRKIKGDICVYFSGDIPHIVF